MSEVGKAKRASVAKKETAEDASSVTFTFSNGHSFTAAVSDFSDSIKARLLAHGISQKIGDSYASVKGIVDDAIENAEATYETLKNGEWSDRAEGVGPRPSMVADAIAQTLRDTGETVDEARMLSIREKVKVKETREGALKNPAIKAVYEQMRLEAAKARTQAAIEAAKNAPAGSLGDF
jgi:flavin-binding protein dodecin